MAKVLINFAHPARSRSVINNALRKAVHELKGVTVNDLYANYPDFLINVKREQELCEKHDFIIFQHPFYWYSTPSIIKEWFDLVLKYGWAIGSKGNALKGKHFLLALSAGGDDSSYQEGGSNKYSIPDLLLPFKATAESCKMTWLPPFTVLGVHRGMPEDCLKVYAEDYRRAIIALRDETMDLDKVKNEKYLNSDLNNTIKQG